MSIPKEKEVDRLAGLILDRFGDRLTEQQRVEVKKSVETIVDNAVKMREIRLENSDEPFTVFIPFRDEP
ncbi:MAG: hypothetical protein NTV15_05530 [Candidatus Bathyarchaeota archaeon]|nr:hypothetical protein [Candidatus Bathyarchaeota archaeon]